VLFKSGNAAPSIQAKNIIRKVAQILNEYNNPIHVEGFTDDIPIQNDFYPSNWELSSARAAAVVRLLALGDVAPDRMAAVGYAEFRPVAENTTEEGRAKNRRVSMIISKDNESPKISNTLSANGKGFKLGAVTLGQTPSESSNAFDLASRRSQSGSKKKIVPLKIIKLENGGILFSSESAKSR